MNTRNTEFDRAMAILTSEHKAARTPLRVEQAVVAEFDAFRLRRRMRIAGAGTAIAAMLIAGALAVRERPTRDRAGNGTVAIKTMVRQPPGLVTVAGPVMKPKPRKRSVVRHQKIPRDSAAEPFVAIPYTVPLAPDERAAVVRLALSPSAFAAVGFPLPAIDPGNDTLADVLVGEDGRAHAIRIVADSAFR
jgi:hypothetical protein